MKRTAAILAAILLAASCTGCGSSGTQTENPAAQNSTAAENSASANAESTAQVSGVVTDGSKCGILQNSAEQDDFEIKGLILTSDSGHHDYPAIDEQIKDGYKTEGLCSEFYLNEWIGVYADCNQTMSLYVVKNQPDIDYAAMSELDLIKASGESQHLIYQNNITPNADENGYLLSFYVHPESGEGLYNMCFVSGEKVCYVVQLRLLPEPTE